MPELKPVAIVGIGAIMPDAPDAPTFWNNIKMGRYSIIDVPADRWDSRLYYDADPSVVDKTYSKIGSWVRGFKLETLKWGIAIPPRVIQQMDEVQQWAIAAAREALLDYGYPKRTLNPTRVAVILGNAMGGEHHYISTMRVRTPEFQQALAAVPQFQNLPPEVQKALLDGMRQNIWARIPEITEDTMPGELSNIIAGRVANVFNFQGPNFTTDAACASSLAALQAAVEGLNHYHFDAVLSGGMDRMMGPEGFVKFSKIGALSPDGSRPYSDGANGFVMGEGAGVFLLKRLEDAERDGDPIYAVVRGIGGSSDGKGKGITAPNPTGQLQAIERAWQNAGLNPATVGLIEGHGTSTKVGDVVEVNGLNAVFGQFGLPKNSIALGSVKSNIGHLKSAAGAAGLLKVAMALRDKVLPPSLNYERPNPSIDFSAIPMYVNTQLRDWQVKKGEIRRAAISSFGFGGTNFHMIVDEYVPGMLSSQPQVFSGVEVARAAAAIPVEPTPTPSAQAASSVQPYRGLLFLSADNAAELRQALVKVLDGVKDGAVPPSGVPNAVELARHERIAIDYADRDEFVKRAERALKGFDAAPGANPWTALVAHGVFHGSGEAGKVAFLFPGQGSQYVNMLKDLCAVEPLAADTFAEADRIMEPILGKPLTSFIYVDGDEAAVAEAEKALRNTEITQPAMLTANVALLRLMNKFGFQPDMVIGHSLGEYAALVSAGVLTFAEALEVVSARGQEMKKVSWDDNGCMAAVSAPIGEVEKILSTIDGYVVIANINSPMQSVIGGTTQAVDAAMVAFAAAGFQGTKIPVSHAFHTKIVEPASGPLRQVIARMSVLPPKRMVIANVTGDVYPEKREEILDILASQVASPVQFIKGMQTLYAQGARVFAEIGPKRVLNALAMDNLKGKTDVMILATNHPREGAVVSFNKAICGLYAAGIGPKDAPDPMAQAGAAAAAQSTGIDEGDIKLFVVGLVSEKTGYPADMLDLELDLEADLGVDTVKQAELFAAVRTHYHIPRRDDLRLSDYNTLTKVIGYVTSNLSSVPVSAGMKPAEVLQETFLASNEGDRNPVLTVVVSPIPAVTPRREAPAVVRDGRLPMTGSVVISGAGLGLPGKNGKVFDDSNIASILRGDVRIEQLPDATRQAMLAKRVTRLIKSESGAVMEVIDQLDQTVKLAGQRGEFNLAEEFGVKADRVGATDISTQLAIAAGIDALRDAGIPLVMAYKLTSKGTYLPDRWRLPEALADETGVIFGSAFPGLDEMAAETANYYAYETLVRQASELRSMLALVANQPSDLRTMLEKRIRELDEEAAQKDYHFDRRLVFRILAMGHSQFAEFIGARGPNIHVNAACATTTHAVSLAEDWIRAGRARRVVIIAGDDVTSGDLVDWVGTGLMASGAATVEGNPRLAILPFDKRRNGMVMGMGGAALVVESQDALRERGMRGIAEVMATTIANSAYHGTRLDPNHVSEVMERLVHVAEQRFNLKREDMAARTVFVSHETYTPARGGSASAEIRALRRTFGSSANRVVIANTKGYTGHTMGVGVEDVVAVKALETGIIPPIANIHNGFEPDPDLGDLNLSKGGVYNPEFSLRLGAGFGSQIAMTLLRKVAGTGERVQNAADYQTWLAAVAGYESAETEVVQRTLRISHQGEPVRPPRKSQWEYGQGPTLWANEMTGGQVNPAAQTPSTEKVAQSHISAPVIDTDAVHVFVLGLVSEKTGYPTEMLDLDLDLEADLGIDTVKQAELFAAVRSQYGIERRDDVRLSDYNTLSKVIDFVVESKGVTKSPRPVAVVEPPVVGANVEEVKQFVLGLVSEKTGYPTEMLDLDLDLEADLGIDTVKQAELFAAVRSHYDIPRRDDLRLSEYNTLTKVIGFVTDSMGEASAVAQVTTAAASAGEPTMPSSAAAASNDEIKRFVLAVVSEKTGYPEDMLDLELDLEADLGIDTVKQAELFAMVRSHFGIPRRDDLRLSDYNTLTKVIGFVADGLAHLHTQPSAAAPVVEPVETAVEAVVEQEPAVTYPRRVPVVVLRPRLDLCAPTGVALGASSRVVILSDNGAAGEELARSLAQQTEGKAAVLLVKDVSGEDGVKMIQGFCADGHVSGVYDLTALDAEPELRLMDADGFLAEMEKRGIGLFSALKAIPGSPFVIGATRMGGVFGYETQGASAPMGGLVSGLIKALRWERPESFAKVVDFEAGAEASVVAERLLAETLNDPAVVEVGWKKNLRYTIDVRESETAASGMELKKGSVFVVSGGSGGITGPIVVDLARATQGKFYLLSRTPLPECSDPDLARLKTERKQLKADMLRRLAEQGEKATPAVVDQKLAALDRAAQTLDTIAAIEVAGGQALYLICDVSDSASSAQAVARVAQAEGQIDVFIHAAGYEHSRKLETKADDEFRKTLAVKAAGFFHLFKAMETQGRLPGAVVFFSSVAGRFGNTGQTDYSAANDYLCKLASAMRAQYPAIRAIALDWGAWAEVGMASRGFIPELMKRIGIEMMLPGAAARLVRRELLSTGLSGEVILAGNLGQLLKARDALAGLDLEKSNAALAACQPGHTLVSQVVGLSLHEGLVLEAELNPNEEPFLRDHALNGIPLLPGVMGIEGLSTAALRVVSALAGQQGNLQIERMENVNFLAALKFYKGQNRRLTWKADVVYEGGALVANMRLESALKRYGREPEQMLHFTAKVYLRALDASERLRVAAPPNWDGTPMLGADEIYKLYFHGPAFQVLEGVKQEGAVMVGKLRANRLGITASAHALVSAPLLVELCMQTAGVWEIATTGTLALPKSIGQLRVYCSELNGEALFAEVSSESGEDGRPHYTARVKDNQGKVYIEVEDYRTEPLPYTLEKELLQPVQEWLKGDSI
jgi:malonyl CoA-acyl carrier protein transacylase